ncbi:MAG: hypothetical protein OXB94_09120 [Nitrospira sp.]|nr:hypothetical protein [Nitrospira sp.]
MARLFDSTEHMDDIEKIYNQMEANCPNPCSTSRKLWELRHACKITSHNPYPETMLEKAVVMLAARGQMPAWFNQCPVASGMNDSSRYRRSAVDLVHWCELCRCARLVEIKWDSVEQPKWKSNDPLDALRQILRYGAAYIYCLVYRRKLKFPATSLIKMNASHVSLEVVAPRSFCQDLIARINKPHGEFINNTFVDSKINGLTMSLKVLAFPDKFQIPFNDGADVERNCDIAQLPPKSKGQAVRDAFNNLAQVWP